MAESENNARRWASLVNPDRETLARLLHAGAFATALVAVGDPWDRVGRGWDAVVIAPLARGLAALDVLGLSADEGYPLIADHSRSELIVLCRRGVAAGVFAAGPQGVRVLTSESYLLVPSGQWGGYPAAWLNRPQTVASARYVDPAELREALLCAEVRRAAGLFSR
ncbi:hypothetical protein AB0B15_38325 [Streptomyces sp. NPDC045456]|uniref:hypothetical protein n=1 Tax=Streptomyces sp. NPDC045456 TaxID=3155254 RepID=UPI0033EE74B1